jgi:hypothetical protein
VVRRQRLSGNPEHVSQPIDASKSSRPSASNESATANSPPSLLPEGKLISNSWPAQRKFEHTLIAGPAKMARGKHVVRSRIPAHETAAIRRGSAGRSRPARKAHSVGAKIVQRVDAQLSTNSVLVEG